MQIFINSQNNASNFQKSAFSHIQIRDLSFDFPLCLRVSVVSCSVSEKYFSFIYFPPFFAYNKLSKQVDIRIPLIPWYIKTKHTPLTRSTFHPDLSPMVVYNPLDNSQSYPCTTAIFILSM